MNKIISRKEILNNADEYIKTQNENLKNTPYFIDEKTAFVLITELSSKIAIIPYFWLPSENLRSKSKKEIR